MSTDRIDKQILLRAPRARVWRALTDAETFGQWFGVKMNGPFTPGARVQGKVTNKAYEHLTFEITIDQMDAEKTFSWRWHPNATDPKIDYSKEPTTLVVFQLEETAEGTLLTVVETGLDGIPLARRAEAYRSNDRGWAAQMKAIEEYVNQETQAAPQN
jgi:uncharacterized protein YndB with AHSA1/START domain